MLIPKRIDSSELLVRFVFEDHFKKKSVKADRIEKREVFMDDRLVGVSMQRKLYTLDKICKERAKAIVNKKYAGFVIFQKNDFLKVCDEFAQVRKKFEAQIKFTPLDKNNKIRQDIDSVYIDDEGNPSHCDIDYINPAMENLEANPKIALRAFSQQLYGKACLIIDNDPDNENFNMIDLATQYTICIESKK